MLFFDTTFLPFRIRSTKRKCNLCKVVCSLNVRLMEKSSVAEGQAEDLKSGPKMGRLSPNGYSAEFQVGIGVLRFALFLAPNLSPKHK